MDQIYLKPTDIIYSDNKPIVEHDRRGKGE